MIPDDLSIPEFLRRPLTPEASASIRKLVEQDKHRFRTRRFRRRHLTDEQATERRIQDEADRRWRSWVPSKEEHHRPRLATFARLVRKEFKAKVKAELKEETAMAKSKAKSKPNKMKTLGVPPIPASKGVRPGSKLEAIVGLLRRDEGCTTADVLQATGWPSVSMPQQAKAAGLELRKEKVNGITVYRAACFQNSAPDCGGKS